MSRKKNGEEKRLKRTYRNGNDLVVAKYRFKSGEKPVPLGSDEKGDVKALLQGISLGIMSKDEITSQVLVDMEYSYLNYVYEADIYIVPDFLGFCAFCGMTKSQMDYFAATHMRKEPCFDPFGNEIMVSPAEVISKIKNDFLAVKSQLGLSGKIPPVVFIATMNNEGDWTTRTELTLAPQNPIQTNTNAELDRMIADFENEKVIDVESKEIEN